MNIVQYRLSLPAATPLDGVVDRISTLRRAAGLLPVQSISPLRILGSEDIKTAAEHDVAGLGCVVFGLTRRIGIQYNEEGEPSISASRKNERVVEVVPCRAVGFSIQPGFESDRFDLFLADYPEFIQVVGRGSSARRRFKVPTNRTGWTCDSLCITGARDSTLIDFLKSHLLVIALLDSAHDLGVEVDAADDGDYWSSRSLEKLIAVFPGNEQENWSEHSDFIVSLQNLAELTGAVDLHLLPLGEPE